MARIITITSGKGGVGKTSVSLNLSLSLASRGFKVCLFDADLGLANVNILTGIYPKQDLMDVISEQAGLDDILIKNYQGIDIIPGSNGVEKLADLTPVQTRRLINAFLELEDYDYFIFDTSAGISSQVISFCMASHEIVLVVTCEPTSITDAYSMLKSLSRHGYENPVKILVNQVKTGSAAKTTYVQLRETVNRFLRIKVEPLGIVGWDKNVRMAVISQTPFFMVFPNTLASKCIRTITDKLLKKVYHETNMPLELFWDRCLAFFETHREKEKQPPVSPAGNSRVQGQPGNPNPLVSKTEPPAAGRLQTDDPVYQAIERIDTALSNLTREVALIRKMLEPRGSEPEFKPVSPEPPPPPRPEKIALDFESWLKENKKQFTRL